MRRFFVVLFILSLCATGASLYWRSTMPEAPARIAVQGGSRSMAPDAASRPAAVRPSQAERAPSDRQDLAVTISIVSSVVSALAALVQTWLTAKAIPGRARG
jgi:hypothetical protein